MDSRQWTVDGSLTSGASQAAHPVSWGSLARGLRAEARIPREMRRLHFSLLVVLACVGPAASAQTDLGPEPRVYLGAGIVPGVGGFAAYAAPRLSVFTLEGALYADYAPRVTGGSGRLLVAVGVGGGLRALRIAGIVTNFEPGPLDVDVGLRLGPSFYYAFSETTAEEEARSFRVMLEAFARGTLRLGAGRVVFVELGGQAPNLRGGLALRFGS